MVGTEGFQNRISGRYCGNRRGTNIEPDCGHRRWDALRMDGFFRITPRSPAPHARESCAGRCGSTGRAGQREVLPGMRRGPEDRHTYAVPLTTPISKPDAGGIGLALDGVQRFKAFKARSTTPLAKPVLLNCLGTLTVPPSASRWMSCARQSSRCSCRRCQSGPSWTI